MLFNSHAFLFAFLPATLALFHLTNAAAGFRAALGSLVLCSLAFYGLWQPAHLALLLASVAVNFALGRRLHDRSSMPLLALGIGANLALIGAFKYADFALGTFGTLVGWAHTPLALALPLGISFFTFQQITYLVDANRGAAPRYTLLDYAQFVTFFPQLIAGPIVHHHEMLPQFTRARMLGRVPEHLAVGLTLLAVGLFKKVVLADSVAVHATPVFDAAAAGVAITFWEAWIGAGAYTLQLYFDFSGYSDMAIGLARLFGIVLPANFDSPYRAASIVEFWRRWHMTLSRFLRDYLYIPLGGARRGTARRWTNLAVTMLLGGLWHGAGWTFVAWGALHGAYLIVNHAWRRVARGRAGGLPGRVAAHALTLLAVTVAWVVFRAEDLGAAGAMLGAMAGADGIAVPAAALARLPEAANAALVAGGPFANELVAPGAAFGWVAALALLALAAPNVQQLMRAAGPVLGEVRAPTGTAARLAWRPCPGWAVATGLLALYALLSLGGVSEFLYFRF